MIIGQMLLIRTPSALGASDAANIEKEIRAMIEKIAKEYGLGHKFFIHTDASGRIREISHQVIINGKKPDLYTPQRFAQEFFKDKEEREKFLQLFDQQKRALAEIRKLKRTLPGRYEEIKYEEAVKIKKEIPQKLPKPQVSQPPPLKPPTPSPSLIEKTALKQLWRRIRGFGRFFGEMSVVAIPPLLVLDAKDCQELWDEISRLKYRRGLIESDFDRLPQRRKQIEENLGIINSQIAKAEAEYYDYLCQLIILKIAPTTLAEEKASREAAKKAREEMNKIPEPSYGGGRKPLY